MSIDIIITLKGRIDILVKGTRIVTSLFKWFHLILKIVDNSLTWFEAFDSYWPWHSAIPYALPHLTEVTLA